MTITPKELTLRSYCDLVSLAGKSIGNGTVTKTELIYSP